MFAEQLEKAGVKNLAAAVRKKNPKTFNEVSKRRIFKRE